MSPSAPDRACTSESAAVSLERGDPNQGGDLLTAQGAQLRHTGEHGRGPDGPNSRHAWHQVVLLPPEGTWPNGCGQVLVKVSHAPFQPGDVGLDLLWDLAWGLAPASVLRHEPLHELAAPRQLSGQLLSLSIGPRPRGGWTASANWAQTRASSVSVFARCPMALAKSRTCRGVTMTTGHPAAAHAIVRASSTPPVASHTTSVGRRATRRVTNIATPASVCALVPCSPAGRTATSNWAFEPSIPKPFHLASWCLLYWPSLARYGLADGPGDYPGLD